MGMRVIQISIILFMSAISATTANAAAPRSCLDKINDAVKRANRLPASAGRAAVITDIDRARDARHEGDEAGCNEQIDETLAVLRQDRKARATR